MTPNIKLELDRSKKRKTDGLSPIYIMVYWNGTRAKETTGIYLSESDFKKGLYKYDKKINKRLSEVNERISELILSKKEFNAKDILSKSTITSYKIMMEMFNIKKLSLSTIKSYRAMYSSITDYFGSDFKFENLTLNMIRGYARFNKNTPATVGCYLKCLKSLLFFAVERGYIKENVMHNYSYISEGYRPKQKPKARTEEEIESYIYIFNNTENKFIKESIGIWLSSYFFCGLALVDLMKVDWNNIEIKKLNYGEFFCTEINRQKTNELARIVTPVTTLTKKLLQLLQSEPWKGKTQYHQTINIHLQKIDKTLTYYQARHSFCSTLVRHNKPLNSIAALMGRNVSGLSTYIEQITQNDILASATKIFDTDKLEYDKKQELEIFNDLI